MSCVAEAKARSQNIASVIWKNFVVGSVNATSAKATATMNCSSTVQPRLVPRRSTIGDHSGLMTQGR
jgi:hypothetical protein